MYLRNFLEMYGTEILKTVFQILYENSKKINLHLL